MIARRRNKKTALAACGQNGAKARPTRSAGEHAGSLCGQSRHNRMRLHPPCPQSWIVARLLHFPTLFLKPPWIQKTEALYPLAYIAGGEPHSVLCGEGCKPSRGIWGRSPLHGGQSPPSGGLLRHTENLTWVLNF